MTEDTELTFKPEITELAQNLVRQDSEEDIHSTISVSPLERLYKQMQNLKASIDQKSVDSEEDQMPSYKLQEK